MDTANIRTRKLWEPKTRTFPAPTTYENKDFSFFDVTILRDSIDNKIDSINKKGIFYIGVQNRRTDPLVYIKDTITTPPNFDSSAVKFYSSAEFDKGVQSGNNIFLEKNNNKCLNL